MNYYCLAQPQEGRTVPVIGENVGPYPSLQSALEDNPGFHEARDDEYEVYLEYWNNHPKDGG